MSLPSQRGVAKLKLVERRRREIADVFPYDRKCAPKSIGFESHYDPCTRIAADAAYKLQIAPQAIFIYKVNRRGDVLRCDHTESVNDYEFCEFQQQQFFARIIKHHLNTMVGLRGVDLNNGAAAKTIVFYHHAGLQP